MAEDEKDRELEALLDSLLSDYSAEPRPGLEIRLRARLKAHAAQRRLAWTLGFAAAAAVVLGMTMVALHSSRPIAPHHVVASTPSRSGAASVIPAAHPSRRPKAPPKLAAVGQPKARTNPSQLLLQAVNSMPSADNLVLAHEKLYLVPAPQAEAAPTPQSPTSAPNIGIQDLGVQSIEIKELPIENSGNSKGNLR